MGGGTWALLITGASLLFTTPLLGSNTLFQPVSFNQLMWFLLAYCTAQFIRQRHSSGFIIIGLVVGIAILTKYSVAFYILAILLGLLMTKERGLVFTPSLISTVSIALLVALPNILWQYNHGLPLFRHMQELQESQLIHVDFSYFYSQQFTFHKGFTIIWLFGILGLFYVPSLKSYRSLGWAFIFTLLLIGLLHGKPYYTLGAFLILFPFGGLAMEALIPMHALKGAFLSLALVLTLPFYPLSIPLLKAEGLKHYCAYLTDRWGMKNLTRWEDGKYYDLPQDEADMHGWEELARKVAKIYHALPPNKKGTCMIYGGSYGHAGALNYYRAKYDLPRTYSLNSSYAFWAEEDVNFDNQIMVDDRLHEGSSWFDQMELIDSLNHPYAREKGYIYYRSQPLVDVVDGWKKAVQQVQGE